MQPPSQGDLVRLWEETPLGSGTVAGVARSCKIQMQQLYDFKHEVVSDSWGPAARSAACNQKAAKPSIRLPYLALAAHLPGGQRPGLQPLFLSLTILCHFR